MNAEAIFDFVRRVPFEPFVLRMSNGESPEIRHPECIVIGKNRAVVCFPEQDRFICCAMMDIDTVEVLQAT